MNLSLTHPAKIIVARIPLAERFARKVVKSLGCWKWLAHKNRWGYGTIYVNGKDTLAHRASWIIHNGEIPNGLFVLHRCDNPECTNPEHLFLGTNADNMKDMKNKGRARSPKGEDSKRSKITREDAIAIRLERMRHRTPFNTLGKKYGISGVAARHVCLGRTWNHVHQTGGIT